MFKSKSKWVIAALAATLLFSTITFAETVLTKIYVDFNSVNKIVIDGEDRTPTGTLKPFAYNGSNFVPIRYVAEALGKPVKWDGTTKTIYIGTGTPLSRLITDSLLKPISTNWDLINKLGTWSVDERNGAYADSHRPMDYILPLDSNKYNINANSYSVEVDIAISDGANTFAGLFFQGSLPPDVSKLDKVGILNGALVANGDSKKINFVYNQYYKLRVVLNKNDQKTYNADIYLDGKYITSATFSNKSLYTGLYSVGYEIKAPPYFKNFKLTVN